MTTRNLKARAEEFEDQYENARDEEFNDQFEFFLKSFMQISTKEDWNLKDITGEDIQGFLDSFTFPDINDWCFDQVQSEIDTYEDQKYEEARERQWEQEDRDHE